MRISAFFKSCGGNYYYMRLNYSAYLALNHSHFERLVVSVIRDPVMDHWRTLGRILGLLFLI